MKGEDSIFSFIKQPEHAESAPPRPAAPPVQAAPPPPAEFEKLAARIAALEAKVKGGEPKDAGQGNAAAEGLRAELQASQQRIAELERFVTELHKFSEAAGREARAAGEAARLELGRFRAELGALRAKDESVEQLGHGLTEAADRSLKNFEAGVLSELKERLHALDAASADLAQKANLIGATTSGNAHRIDKLEERAAGVKYLENRLESNDKKLEKLYELEAVVQAVKVGMEGLENKFGLLAQDAAVMSAEHKGIRSDFESTTHQVKQLTALFNYFRTELAFLLPKKKEGAGELR